MEWWEERIKGCSKCLAKLLSSGGLHFKQHSVNVGQPYILH